MKYMYCAAAMLSLLACISVAEAGDTYKWKDDKGQVVYTDTPPRDRPYEVIKQRKYDTTAQTGSSETGKPATGKDAAPAAGTSAKKPPQSEAERRKSNCDIAKNNQKTLTEVTRIRITENGEERMLSDEERAAKIKAVEKDIQYWCDGQ